MLKKEFQKVDNVFLKNITNTYFNIISKLNTDFLTENKTVSTDN